MQFAAEESIEVKSIVFITLGSQKFQLNRLLQKVDELIEDGTVRDDVFAQIGYSSYVPKNFTYEKFLNQDKYKFHIDHSNIVITHGGTGAIISALKAGKKVLAVPRLVKYGEHVDNHQLQLLKQFEENGLICTCYEIENLKEAYLSLEKHQYTAYISNTAAIINSIEKFLVKR
jgi:UDP-N-acetylglucosamine transferase subunit ALG13